MFNFFKQSYRDEVSKPKRVKKQFTGKSRTKSKNTKHFNAQIKNDRLLFPEKYREVIR